jgi:nucleotide-binding universal stress UspA family protein
MKILVAYDGSPAAAAAVEEVLARPWPTGSQVRLVTAIEPLTSAAPVDAVGVYLPVVERIRASVREEAYGQLRRALGRFGARPDLEATLELRDGPAKQALLEAIREWEPDLVVAGSHGKGGLARLLLGSVSHALVTHAPCNVEIVKLPPVAA